MFKFLPIGGVGFIGGNVSYMEIDSFPFLIDTGILFPREESLGINHLFPDLEILSDSKLKTPEYLLLTHAHEDHIGGIKYLLKKFPRMKIVCSSYTKAFIEKKFDKLKINLVSLEDFSNENKNFNFFNLRHSIPGVYGFSYTNKDTCILFCTDFRFDPNEDDSNFLNKKLLKKLSLYKNKVTLLDSTNIASSNDSSLYEKDLLPNIEQEISSSTQDTFVALFPSNTKRLGSIVDICNKLGRPCCLSGFSMEFSYSLGLSTGYIKPIKNSTYVKGESVVLLTGSQGDLRGSFRRVFTQNDKKFKPCDGDKLLYSSKVIPGNEKNVGEMFNKASEVGVHINKGASPIIHSSGHAYSNEIKEILLNFKPSHVVPIHLETSFFQDFITKIDNLYEGLDIHRLENYKMLNLDKEFTASYVDFEKLDLQIYLDGGEVVDKSVINSRRRLGNTGTLFVSIVKDNYESMKINYYGLPDIAQAEIKSCISKIISDNWSSNDLEEELRISIRHYLSKKIGIKPIVFVHLL